MTRWNTAPRNRYQTVLYSPTIDDSIAGNHPVRLFDEVLGSFNFDEWEMEYDRFSGQPPIHPRVLAGCILYGLSPGIRSSRRLEGECINRIDFMWLMDGRTPDHSTICNFRLKFEKPLRALFRRVGRVAMEMGMLTLNQVTLDGTDIRANNSRHNTAKRPGVVQKLAVQKLAVLDQQIDQAMNEAKRQDESEDQFFGGASSPAKLPAALQDLQRRPKRLKAARARLEQMEKERQQRSDRESASTVAPAVPLADCDSRVPPNKTGGYAPNYTAVLATDGDSGIILDSQVLGGNDEASTVMPAISNIQESFGAKPRQLLADSGFNTGENLSDLKEQHVQPLMPARQPVDASAALRLDPGQPVAEEKRAAPPVNPQGKRLDRAAFIYDEQNDRYFCPMGKTLSFAENKKYDHHGKRGVYRIYQCAQCAGCALAARCLAKKSTHRRICRDEHEKDRETMARRLAAEEGQKQYCRRAHIAETPNATIKTKMNFRQFLLRGQAKVAHEWCWATTAYNIMKLMARKALDRSRGILSAPLTA
jgi:transposase